MEISAPNLNINTASLEVLNRNTQFQEYRQQIGVSNMIPAILEYFLNLHLRSQDLHRKKIADNCTAVQSLTTNGRLIMSAASG
ncbi:hypothetical protein NPIL_635021 [Nephila pilipes]|uniref:Uncharacterized protein n=1 Tax=Nephila pilipes TaxID=299642 RepID=A0A8X6QN76_NEPPI|nr:hypothetical protein NPIL_635021 [Nephila pilipes]